MRQTILKAGLCIIGFTTAGSASANLDRLAGCFDVRYAYDEWDFDLGKPRARYEESLKELVELADQDGALKLSHYSVNGTSKTLHWYETWTRASADTWTRNVHGPSGTIRYTASCKEESNQGSVVLTCGETPAPIPRRDLDRSYDELLRIHKIAGSADGFVDIQTNRKRRAGADVAQESGWNYYKRLPADACP
jgi:hypothetical protein